MFSKINTILGTIDAYVWGIPLIVLIPVSYTHLDVYKRQTFSM